MIFIVAPSSADHALETLTPETREKYQDKIFSKKPEKDRSKLALKRSFRQT